MQDEVTRLKKENKSLQQKVTSLMQEKEALYQQNEQIYAKLLFTRNKLKVAVKVAEDLTDEFEICQEKLKEMSN